MFVVHSFSLTGTVEQLLLFTYRHTLPPCCFPVRSRSLSILRGGEKPFMCSVLSSSLLFNHDSVNARTEAVLYSCRWLTQACSSSGLQLGAERPHISQDNGRERSLFACLPLESGSHPTLF